MPIILQDDTTGTELSINELGNAAGSIEEADLVTPLINAVVTGDHRKVCTMLKKKITKFYSPQNYLYYF